MNMNVKKHCREKCSAFLNAMRLFLAAYFCRYSSYQVNPKVLFSLKKQIIGACGFRVVTGKPKARKEIAISKAILENPKAPKTKQCSSIKLTTISKVGMHAHSAPCVVGSAERVAVHWRSSATNK
jgi:hypothetical protein